MIDKLTASDGELKLHPIQANFRWTWGYVENIADMLLECAGDRRSVNRIYNLGYPTGVSMVELYEMVSEEIEWDGTIIVTEDRTKEPGQDLTHHWIADSTKFRRDFDYSGNVLLEDAIRLSVQADLAKHEPSPPGRGLVSHLRLHHSAVGSSYDVPRSAILAFLEWEFRCHLFVDIYTQTRLAVRPHHAVLQRRRARKHLTSAWWRNGGFLNTEGTFRFSIKFAVCPTGDVSPRPCHAVRTLYNSPIAAIFLAGVMPPICDMWIRMKSNRRS